MADHEGTDDGASAGLKTSSSALVTIRGLLPSLAPAERRVAEAVLADPGEVAGKSITALARSCSTSETTVVRFCRTTGFSGYPQLRLALAVEAERAAQPSERAVGGEIGPDDDLDEVVSKVSFSNVQALQETTDHLNLPALAKVVDAVAGARRVELIGIGASAIVTQDLEQKLRRINRVAYACKDTHDALTSAALLTPDDVAIGVSHTGATQDTIAPLVEAASHGAVTVAITNFPRSPITDVVDLVLTTAVRETTFRSGALASRLAQLSVVDFLFVAVAQRTYEQTLDALAATHDAVGPRRFGNA